MDLVKFFQDCNNSTLPVDWKVVSVTLFNGFMGIIQERDKQIAELTDPPPPPPPPQ